MQTARKVAAVKSAKPNPALDSLLKKVVEGKNLLKLQNGVKLFSQGEETDATYFIQTGKVQLTVASAQGREAVMAMLGPHDFLGEECLVGNSRRTSTATSLEPSAVFRIEKRAMLQALHLHPKLSEEFVTSLLARNINLEEDLCAKLPKLTQKMLAESVGTTRSKVNFFMNKFRKLGLIDYRGTGGITVKAELLTEAVLND